MEQAPCRLVVTTLSFSLGVGMGNIMELSEFADKTQLALERGDTALVKALENIARQADDPYYYHWLAWMFEPIGKDVIEAERKEQERRRCKSVAPNPSALLDNIDNLLTIKDCVSANYYFSLAFKGFIKLAENNSDPDAMSVLSDMFALGLGTARNMEKATYWLDRCYLIKTAK